jgi:MFS family permease
VITDSSTRTPDIPDGLYRRVAWRILPLVAVCYAVAIMDRVNIGYASLTMNADIGLSAASYGLGAGVFFLAYCVFEVPSNLLLERFGARAWITRIMVTWGVVVLLTGFVQNEWQFYVARVLLGAAEAGFYPGIVYFLSTWFPRMRLSRALAVLTIAGPVGNIIVGPLSGWILLSTDGAGGMQGWRWLFIIQAIPALIMGIVFSSSSATAL